jgi:hypothetical protein
MVDIFKLSHEKDAGREGDYHGVAQLSSVLTHSADIGALGGVFLT